MSPFLVSVAVGDEGGDVVSDGGRFIGEDMSARHPGVPGLKRRGLRRPSCVAGWKESGLL